MSPSETIDTDLRERGAREQRSDQRLYMKLQVLDGCPDATALVEPLRASGLEAVLYEDLHQPRGAALLTLAEDPATFFDTLHPLLNKPPFDGLRVRPEMTMCGRTYAMGYEPDLEEALRSRPRRHALAAGCPWAVWYPLRRASTFARLASEDQKRILREHGMIGRAFGEAGLVHDVRLACHGLDPADNDFVIGLVSSALHPISALVQRMRGTEQTAHYLERLGPFFVGRVVWRSGGA